MFVFVKIWDCHGNRLRAGLAVCMPRTEAWTSTSLTGRCGRIVTLSDENRGTSGVRSPDEHSNKSRTTSCRSGSSFAVWVSSGGTGFPTIGVARLRGCGNVAGALCPKLPCDRCEMRSAHSRCRVSNNLITTLVVARQDSGCRITRARRTYIHIRTQSRARARAVKTQP